VDETVPAGSNADAEDDDEDEDDEKEGDNAAFFDFFLFFWHAMTMALRSANSSITARVTVCTVRDGGIDKCTYIHTYIHTYISIKIRTY
jgi:hypothetical protein